MHSKGHRVMHSLEICTIPEEMSEVTSVLYKESKMNAQINGDGHASLTTDMRVRDRYASTYVVSPRLLYYEQCISDVPSETNVKRGKGCSLSQQKRRNNASLNIWS